MEPVNIAHVVVQGARGSLTWVTNASLSSGANCSGARLVTMRFMPISTPLSMCITRFMGNITGGHVSNAVADQARRALCGYRSGGRSFPEGHPDQDWEARPVALQHARWYGYRWS